MATKFERKFTPSAPGSTPQEGNKKDSQGPGGNAPNGGPPNGGLGKMVFPVPLASDTVKR